ncbi:MAG: hypothetical protein R3A51_21840 [Nannocystaceae bacterium]
MTPRRSAPQRVPPTRSRALALALLALTLACSSSQHAVALKIATPEADRDAEVYVDGNYMGLVSALDNEAIGVILLAPGVHRVEVRKPGRFPVQRTVRVARGDAGEIVVKAELLEDPR